MTVVTRSLITVILAAACGTALTGCGTTTGSDSDANGAVAAASGSALSTASSCASEFDAWRSNGGGGDVSQFADALTSATNAAGKLAAADAASMSSAETTLQSSAASLQSDAETADAALPPSCVPHLDADLSRAYADYSTAAQDMENAVGEMNSNADVATGDLTAGVKAGEAGDAKLNTALSDVGAWKSDGEP